jgi:predicted O-methyltransferase YrrM
MSSLLKSLKETTKALVFKHTKFAAPSYRYNIEPIQLTYLINEIEKFKHVKGSVIEIGVARGLTTRFLCEHIRKQQLEHTTTLYAIDTFDSFTQADLDFEVRERGKDMGELTAFGYNDFAVWSKNFTEFPFVVPVKADCAAVDYQALAPIKLAFLDVDLYLPTKNTLPKLFDALVSGGAIVCDDVLNNNVYDGAYQAYMEFCAEYAMQPEIIGNKCGVIRKP